MWPMPHVEFSGEPGSAELARLAREERIEYLQFGLLLRVIIAGDRSDAIALCRNLTQFLS